LVLARWLKACAGTRLRQPETIDTANTRVMSVKHRNEVLWPAGVCRSRRGYSNGRKMARTQGRLSSRNARTSQGQTLRRHGAESCPRGSLARAGAGQRGCASDWLNCQGGCESPVIATAASAKAREVFKSELSDSQARVAQFLERISRRTVKTLLTRIPFSLVS
jgi:hypothetical protein